MDGNQLLNTTFFTNSFNYKNILFIDKDLPDFKILFDSVNSNTFPILYSRNDSKKYILNILNKFSVIDRIAICFMSSNKYIFLDNKPLFLDNENVPYSENLKFIIDIISKFSVKYIDFITCNTLKYENWNNYYNILKNNTNVIIGASDKKVGNSNYGGDWIMKTTNIDIKFIYFNENICYFNYLLDYGYSSIIVYDNILYSCGDNSSGQLGIGYNSDYEVNLFKMKIPNSIPASVVPMLVASGSNFTIVLFSDNTVYGCGDNSFGQLGNGTYKSSYILTPMTNPPDSVPVYIACGGSFTIVLMEDGSIYGCGYNSAGELGNGTTNSSNILTKMIIPNSIPNDVVPISVACGFNLTIVVFSDNTVYGTGYNLYGQLGLGNNNTYNVSSLTQMITTGLIPVYVACGYDFTLILMKDGSIYGCGDNLDGQLGNTNIKQTNTTLTPMQNMPLATPLSIVCGFHTAIVLMQEGTIYGTGGNSDGELGIGNTNNVSNLTKMIIPNSIPNGVVPISIASGGNFTIVSFNNNTFYATGNNSFGQLGNETNNNSIELTQMIIATEPIPCFNETTKILGLNNNLEEEYFPIEKLKIGDIVKTYKHGYRKIKIIFHNKMLNNPKIFSECMYKMEKTDNNELIEDLIVTGGHSILVDDLEDNKEKNEEFFGSETPTIDNKFLLLSAVSNKFNLINESKIFTYYHIILENDDDDDRRYGIWANGILTETPSMNYYNNKIKTT
jgi:alpha-tubulin suppressor-like RCC1 family protein